jgi:hypothetical protein
MRHHGVAQDDSPRHMVAALRHERSSVQPYGAQDQRPSFTPQRIAITNNVGLSRYFSRRNHPRASANATTNQIRKEPETLRREAPPLPGRTSTPTSQGGVRTVAAAVWRRTW